MVWFGANLSVTCIVDNVFRAMFDFDGVHQGDLAFKKGDRLSITSVEYVIWASTDPLPAWCWCCSTFFYQIEFAFSSVLVTTVF